MPDREQVARDIEQLKQASVKALDENDFLRAVQLSQARKQLETWMNGGLAGPAPVDAAALLSRRAPAAVSPAPARPAGGEAPPPPPKADTPPRPPGRPVVVPPAPQIQDVTQPPETRPAAPPPRRVEPARPAPAGPDAAPAGGTDDNQLRRLVEEARRGLAQAEPQFAKALAMLEQVVARARDPLLRSSAQLLYTEAQLLRNRRREELVAQAQRIQQSEPFGPRLRSAWEAVLQVDPDDEATQQGLRQLDERERSEEWRRRIRELRVPLTADRKDIREVQTARRKAVQLQESHEVADPELRLQLDETCRQLNDLRDAILKASKGGTSAERAKDFENAIKTYQDARDAGYDVIIDDMTGDPINVHEALRRTRKAYWDDLVMRAGQRYGDAERALEDGYPETAVNWLEEATDLLHKVEEGGEETRKQVDQLLSRAREARTKTTEARRLVNEATAEADPQSARSKLVAAKQLYPDYPDIDQRLAEAEHLVLAQVVRDMAVDLSMARGALGGLAADRFDKARQLCRQANQRGANLTITRADLADRRREVEELLAATDQQEQTHYRMAQQLAPVDTALQDGDIRLARLLLEDLADFRDHPEVRNRRQRLVLLQDDDVKYHEAEERFLYGDYPPVIQLCDALIADNSPKYRASADQLRRQAQARLWLDEAEAQGQTGQLAEAEQTYQLLAGLQGTLPPTDQHLIDKAQAGLAEVRRQQARQQELDQRLRAAVALRQHSPVSWEAWYAAVHALQQEVPAWLRPEVDSEFMAGAESWSSAALEKANELLQKGNVRASYQELEGLHRLGLIPDRNDAWRRIEYAYCRAEAERLLAGYSPAEFAQAEAMAHQAHRAAPDSQRQSADDFLREAICQAVLKSATIEAASADPGPAGAVRRLQARLEQEPSLLTEARIRARLIRYFLDLQDFDKAAQQARLMVYVPGERDRADGWLGLVEAVTDFNQGLKSRGVKALANLRNGMGQPPASESFREVVDHAAGALLTSLHADINPSASLTDQVSVLNLILQVNPDDSAAQAELIRLSASLEKLARQWCDEFQSFKLGSSLAASLGTAVRQQAEAESLRRALEHIRPDQSDIQRLAAIEHSLVSQLEAWRLAAKELEAMEQLWAGCVASQDPADVKEAEDQLARVQAMLDRQAVVEVSRWSRRLDCMKTYLGASHAELAAIRAAWRSDEFDVVVDRAAHLETLVRDAAAQLQEPRLSIPADHIECLDTLQGQQASDLATLREWARQKRSNLAIWQKWQADFCAAQTELNTLGAQIEAQLTARPPCLSRPLAQLDELEAHLATLLDQLERQPERVLCGKARAIAQQYARASLVEALHRMQRDVEAQRGAILARLQRVQRPLERLRRFANRKGTVLSAAKNRETMRHMIDEIRAIDSCNPDAAAYEDMLKERFER